MNTKETTDAMKRSMMKYEGVGGDDTDYCVDFVFGETHFPGDLD